MKKVKVGVAGYGVIGQRLADGVALQGDMELVGVADVAPTLSVRALKERGMPYALYTADPSRQGALDEAGIPVSGTLEDLVQQVDIMLDATSAGVGLKNKEIYQKSGKKAVFQGGEKNPSGSRSRRLSSGTEQCPADGQGSKPSGGGSDDDHASCRCHGNLSAHPGDPRSHHHCGTDPKERNQRRRGY